MIEARSDAVKRNIVIEARSDAVKRNIGKKKKRERERERNTAQKP